MAVPEPIRTRCRALRGRRTAGGPGSACPRVARPVVAHAVRTVVEQAVAGLPEAWRRSVRDAAWRGAAGLPEALDEALREDAGRRGRGRAVVRGDGQGGAWTQRSVRYRSRDGGGGGGRRRAAPSGLVDARVHGATGAAGPPGAGAGWVVAAALGADVGEEWMGVALLLGGCSAVRCSRGGAGSRPVGPRRRTGSARSGGCGGSWRGAGRCGCWSRWPRSCCATGRCGSST